MAIAKRTKKKVKKNKNPFKGLTPVVVLSDGETWSDLKGASIRFFTDDEIKILDETGSMVDSFLTLNIDLGKIIPKAINEL